MPEPGDVPRLVAEVRPDLEVAEVTVDVAGRPPMQLEAHAAEPGQPARWSGPIPPTEAGGVTHYRVRIHLRDADTTPIWASDSDPRPGGQLFAYESAPPPPPEWVRDALCYHVMVDRFARPGESLPAPGDATALYGGTLDGIREHMDHIAGLGCNVLWLSPVHQSPSHHGYDHEDFLTVEPRYGGGAAPARVGGAPPGPAIHALPSFLSHAPGPGHH